MNPPPLPKAAPERKPASKRAIIIAIGILVLFIVIRSNSETEAPVPGVTTAAAPAKPAGPPKPLAASAAATVTPTAPVATAARATPEPNVFERREALKKKALAGDYQAQRNLAYSLSSEFPANTLGACAWRIVILNSGSSDVDDSDLGNKHADCDRKLSPEGIYAAAMQSITLGERIETRKK